MISRNSKPRRSDARRGTRRDPAHSFSRSQIVALYRRAKRGDLATAQVLGDILIEGQPVLTFDSAAPEALGVMLRELGHDLAYTSRCLLSGEMFYWQKTLWWKVEAERRWPTTRAGHNHDARADPAFQAVLAAIYERIKLRRAPPCLPNRKALYALILEGEGDEAVARASHRQLQPHLQKACCSRNWRHIVIAMSHANDCLRGHGVEIIRGFRPERPQDNDEVDLIEFVNQGDAYNNTLCYLHERGCFVVSDWGTQVELLEQKGYRFP